MSRTFSRIITGLIPFEKMNTKNQLIFFTSIIGGHLLYTIGTVRYEMIHESHKYSFVRDGYTAFMIVDSLGNHYNVNNSFWYNKWDSIEDWDKIKTDHLITIKYYGFRVPIFGLFPNIIMSNQDEINSSINQKTTQK